MIHNIFSILAFILLIIVAMDMKNIFSFQIKNQKIKAIIYISFIIIGGTAAIMDFIFY